MDVETIELIFQAKDEASAIVARLKEALETVPGSAGKIRAATDEISQAFHTLGVTTTADLDLQRAAIESSYLQIKHSGTSTADEIQRAEAARAKAIEEIDSQSFATRTGLLDTMKEHWIAVTGAIIAAWATISQGKEFLDLGAAALQAEESFHQVTASYDIDGDALLAKMKEVSAGIIDDSDLMQRAVGALQQGLNPDQIVSLLEVARSSARVAGIDVAAAFDRITEATANQMTRGLKSLGIVVDQNKAFEDYANTLGIAKEALNEQQQSQALANAAIEEGLRQKAAMNIDLLNESEMLQKNAAAWHQLKEEIGKELLSVLGFASRHLQEIGAVLAGLAVVGAAAAINKIKDAFSALSMASGSAGMALKVSIIAVLAEAELMLIKYIIGVEKAEKAALDAQKRLGEQQHNLEVALSAQGFTGTLEEMIQKMHEAKAAGLTTFTEIKDAAGKTVPIIQTIANELKNWQPVFEAQNKTMEAQLKLFLALIKEDFEKGAITMEAYVQKAKEANEKATSSAIASAQMRIESIKQEASMRSINEDETEAKIAAVEESISQIKIEAANENMRIDKEAAKIRDEGFDEREKAEENAFNNWKDMQALRLQVLKTELDLEAAQDEVAVRKGELAEAEALQRKLDRATEYYEREIAIAEETANRIIERTGLITEKDRAEYEKAVAEREKLQSEMQANIITSEQQIAEAREKGEADANSFIAQATNDRIAMVEAEKEEKLKKLEEFYQQDLVNAEQYEAAKKAIDEKAAADSEKIMNESVEKEKKKSDEMQGYFIARTSSLSETLKTMIDFTQHIAQSFGILYDPWKKSMGDTESAMVQFLNAVKKDYADIVDTMSSAAGRISGAWDDIKASGMGSIKDIEELFQELLWDYQTNVEGFYNWMTGAGKAIAASVGLSANEWIERLAQYVDYVKSLMASLEDEIRNYQDELDRLKGNELAILDRWYEAEKDRLKQKYLDELGDTAEYYKAMALLDELYAEKKEQVLDDLKKAQDDYKKSLDETEDKNKGKAGNFNGEPAGGGGEVPVPAPDFSDLMKDVQDNIAASFKGLGDALGDVPPQDKTTVTKTEVSGDFTVNIETLDPETTRRWLEDDFWPLFKRKLELTGVTVQ